MSLRWVPSLLALLLMAPPSPAQEFDPKGLAEAIQASRKASQAAAAKARPYVLLSRFVCAGAGLSEADLSGDLREAREVFAACGVDVRAQDPVAIISEDAAPCPPDFKLAIDHSSPVLTPGQRGLFRRYHHRDRGLSVFYLPWSAGPDAPTLGGSAIPEDYIRRVKGDNETDRASVGAFVVFHKARPFMAQRFVLPHEMGHILINDSSHPVMPGDLMEAFNKGHALTKEQCGRIRASPLLRRD